MIDIAFSGTIPRVLTRAGIERALCSTFLAARRRPMGSVSVAFVTDPAIQRLNRKWRRKNRPTDVLSFTAADFPSAGKDHLWGELFVAPTYVRRSAVKQGVPYREELMRVLIHGLLHLFGYDHAELADEKKMFAIQERVLAKSME